MIKPLNILIVEDSAEDANLAVEELRRAGYDPKWKRVENEPDFLEEIKKQPDIILADYSMPQFTGLRAAKLLQASGLDIPFILISGTVGEDVAVEAMKHGATDYFLKDRISRLGPAITNALEQKRLRKEREQAGASLNLFRALLDRSNDGIEVIDPETGYFLDVNETTCRRLGYTREELLSMKVPSIDVVGATFATWRENVEEIRRVGFKIIHGQQKRKDGSTFPVEVNVRYVTLDRDYLIAAVRDITERKQLEAEVALREQRLNAFFTRAPAGLVLLDANLRYIQLNDTLAEMNGVAIKEHLGKTVREILPKFAPVVEPILKQVLMTGVSVLNMEFSGETPAQPGIVRHWMESFFPILETDGRVGGVGAIAVEITERKRMEEKLRESELKFRQLAEHIRKVFWITDVAKQEMLYVSPAYEKIWGRTCESLYQSPQSWLDAVHPEDRERVQQAAITKQERGDYDETYRIIHQDGSVRWIRDRAFPVRNAAGKLERMVGTAEDVTERKQLEEQFRQAQKQEAIGQLAGGVAHDFNNILTSIFMQVELATMETGLSDQLRESLRHILTDAERAASLTRQLLLFSRRQVMQSRNLDLNEVVTNVARMLQRIIGEDVRLQLNLHPAPLLVHADAGMLDQVLMNLAVNARDAMPGGGRLIIETAEAMVDETVVQNHPEATPGRYICLSVSDNGCGIPADILPRIFEPFFTTKEPGKGTGLGLATVFGIVKQHRGWIKVDSKPGSGTTFQVFLPASTVAATPVTTRSLPKPRGGTETILLVEDEATVRKTTLTLLARHGYTVLEAANGVEALNVWKESRASVSVLLTDLVMPAGVSGQELARRLQADKPELEVIYIGAATP